MDVAKKKTACSQQNLELGGLGVNRYLSEAFALAGWKLRASAPAAEQLAVIEQELTCQVPAALRELLTSKCWPSFLSHFSRCDQPIEVNELLESRWPGYDPTANRILPFMIENQGVCTWAVPLDGSEDPEVMIEVDSGNPPTWQHASPSFSTWLRCQVLDRRLLDKALFAAQAEPLDEPTLAALERAFDEEPRTFAWPGRTQYRFRSTLGELLLWAADDQCDWWIAPASVDTARVLLDTLPLTAEFSDWLYALQPEGEAVLDNWCSATNG